MAKRSKRPPCSPAQQSDAPLGRPTAQEAGADGNGPVAWRKDVNTYYQKVIDFLIGLATGALILPPILLQTYLGVKDEPLLMFLDSWAFTSTGLFVLTIGSGIAFHYTSAKWLKQAWGQPTLLSGQAIERWMDWLFWSAIVGFIGGLACFLQFIFNA